jgi:hypothetical protein
VCGVEFNCVTCNVVQGDEVEHVVLVVHNGTPNDSSEFLLVQQNWGHSCVADVPCFSMYCCC